MEAVWAVSKQIRAFQDVWWTEGEVPAICMSCGCGEVYLVQAKLKQEIQL